MSFFYSGSGSCFLCDEKFEFNSTYEETERRKTSFKMFLRYLGVDLFEHFPSGVSLCQGCSSRLKGFWQLYQEFEKLRLRLDDVVCSFHDTMKLISEDSFSNLSDPGRDQGCHRQDITELREAVIRKCALKVHNIPFVKLKKLTVPQTMENNINVANIGNMVEWEEGKDPLLNEVVIDNISKYLTFEELKVCRGLNHLWKRTTNKMFLKHCPTLDLRSEEDNVHYYYSNKRMTITQFMKIYSDPKHPHPCAQLLKQYCNFEVCNLAEECIPIFYNFMAEVGPQMKSLELRCVKVLRNSQDLVDIVSSNYTPKLEELDIYNVEEIDNYQHNDLKTGKEHKHLRRLSLHSSFKYNRIQWLNVLSGYPKLKALSLYAIPLEVLEEIATGLVTIRQANETKMKLTELEIGNMQRWFWIGLTEPKKIADCQNIGNLLKTANLPLEQMSLDSSVTEISSELLQTYGENLKKLTLKNCIPQPFPLMNTLEEMIVDDCYDLTFLTNVPNLKSFCLYLYPEDDRPRKPEIYCPEPSCSPLMSLTHFSGGCYKEWNVTEMKQLLLWMPNVQSLQIHLNNKTFSWICQHLPNLKELTVWGEDLDDSGVVGEFDEALEIEECRPNITNLKALEKFEMGDIDVFRKKGLTEKSVFYGFTLMPKLSKLTLNVRSEYSADAMLALNRGIKSVRVKVVPS